MRCANAQLARRQESSWTANLRGSLAELSSELASRPALKGELVLVLGAAH